MNYEKSIKMISQLIMGLCTFILITSCNEGKKPEKKKEKEMEEKMMMAKKVETKEAFFTDMVKFVQL